jgi:undecaprenyl diphosphate synthase
MSNNILKHLAIIMDGNGRWAKKRGLIRTKGHEKGADTIRDTTQYCAEHKVKQHFIDTFAQNQNS